VFTAEQLTDSLRATYLHTPVLRASALMDVERLHTDILDHLPTDPITKVHLSDTLNPRWSTNETGYLCLDGRMYIPEADDLHLCVLRYKHDHPLLGHFGQNHTLELIHREYTWPGIHTYVKDYVKSCMACARAKCQVWVYSGRGSGQVQTKTDKERGQRAGQEISPAGVGDRLDSTTKDNER